MAKSTSKPKKTVVPEIEPPVSSSEEKLDSEVKEAINEPPPVETEQLTAVATEPEVVEEKIVEEVPAPKIPAKLDESLSMEEKIVAFLEGKTGFVKINDFIKSLYPLPKFNEPAQWLQQGVNRQLKNMLTNMQTEGKITVRDNRHILLGSAYYPDSTTLKTHYHNLNSVIIEAMGVAKK